VFLSTILCDPIALIHYFVLATEIPQVYPLSLHDALRSVLDGGPQLGVAAVDGIGCHPPKPGTGGQVYGQHLAGQVGFAREPDLRSEEHTSELQSRENLVCRLLLEKKKLMKSHTGILVLK